MDRVCGWALARAHARSGDRVQIAAYLGKSERFDVAIADFAEAYADQTERDHAALCAAVKSVGSQLMRTPEKASDLGVPSRSQESPNRGGMNMEAPRPSLWGATDLACGAS